MKIISVARCEQPMTFDPGALGNFADTIARIKQSVRNPLTGHGWAGRRTPMLTVRIVITLAGSG